MRPVDRETAESWYEASCDYVVKAAGLKGEQKADVVIIGGGLTGASAALCLAEQGVDVALLESRHFGWGASGRSGGQIIAGYSCDQRVLEKLVGSETARDLWDHSLAALEFTRGRIDRHNIRCDPVSGYFHAGIGSRQAGELEEWAEHLEHRYDYGVLEVHRGPASRALIDSPLYSAVVSDPRSGHVHPLNYTLGLVEAAAEAGARIYEGAHVRSISRAGGHTLLETADARIRCDRVVYGCNAYLDGLDPKLQRMIMPVGTCIVATEPLGDRVAAGLIGGGAAVSDASVVLDYYRLSADTRLLFGGRVSYSKPEPKRLRAALEKRMLRVFPQLAGTRIDYAWGGYVAITRNRAPHIGETADGGLFAQGFSGQGMSLSGYAGSLLADAVLGNDEAISCFKSIPHKAFPGGSLFRTPGLMAALAYHSLRDRL